MTLVEVLMAATIFSVIAVGIAGTFFSGIRLWTRISTVDVAGRFALLDLQKLAKDLRGCIDLPLVGFAGTSSGFSFPSIEGSRVVRVAYAFDAGQKKLMRRTYVVDPASDESRAETKATETAVLGADAIRFSFLDNAVTDEIAWLDDWPRERGMFRALRVEGEIKGEPFAKIIIIPQA